MRTSYLPGMSQILNPDELFNEVARDGDRETPVDRFYSLILAVIRSTVSEACRQHAEYPNREPDAGLVHDAAAWIQELMMPDVSQRDIARSITRWIVSQAENSTVPELCEDRAQTKQQVGLIGFM
jgi:hypothetical protein